MSAVYLVFESAINGVTSQKLIATAAQLVNQGTTEINLLLSTPGGEVSSGLTIYNFLRALPITINTHNIGNVDSIGNAIFLAGKTRKACEHSTFMFHGVGFQAPNIVFEEKFLRERLDGILADQKRIGDIIRQRTKIRDSEVRKLFREARTKDAHYALRQDIISAIEDVNIPAGIPIITILTS
jgi:ATP-dependent protease ClpP protease subunit